MRIWHQSFAVLQDQPAYARLLKSRIANAVRADTEVIMHGQVPGTFSTAYPGKDLETSFFWWIHGLQWILAARQAQAEGFDAMVLATIQSPMIREIRNLVDIPVVGYGDGAFNLAGLYGRRTGLMIFNTSRVEVWSEQVKEWGLAERFAGVCEVNVTFQEVVGALANPAERKGVVEKILEAGKRFVDENEADVLVAGQMPMNVLLAESGVHEIAGATVIDGVATCFKLAETLWDLRRGSGMMQSRRGYFHSPADPGRVEEVLKFYGIVGIGPKIPVIGSVKGTKIM